MPRPNYPWFQVQMHARCCRLYHGRFSWICCHSRWLYCSVYSRCWVAASRWATIQHSLPGNRFVISKYTRPLLGNASANKTRSHGNDWSNNRRECLSLVRAEGLREDLAGSVSTEAEEFPLLKPSPGNDYYRKRTLYVCCITVTFRVCNSVRLL
jgi:hypothetical protein